MAAAPKTSPEIAKAEPRRIVGLPLPAAAQGKKRRGKKASGSVSGLELGTTDTVDNLPLVSESVQETVNHITLDTQPAVPVEQTDEEKRFSAVSVVQKRIKALQKKLGRISTYEAEPDKLNPDQQKAVASKPGIELAIKELQELIAVLQVEELEDEKRQQRSHQAQAKKLQAQIQEAVSAHDAEAEVHLAFLLQFLHLRALFQPDVSSFTPPVQPPVISQATSQDFAAVMTLFDALANGPLTGGGEDAMQRIKHLYDGAAIDIVEGVDYARVKQMIGDLTAPPEEVAAHTSAEEVHHEQSNGLAMPTAGISFLQASDIAHLPEPISTPEADPFSKAGPAEPVLPSFDAPATNWADDVDPPAPVPTGRGEAGQQATALDASWGASALAPAIRTVPHLNGKESDGFQPVGSGNTRGRRGAHTGESRGRRGEHRGSSRGRGGRGMPREDGRPPREARPLHAENGPTTGERAPGEGRGRGRGGRGRGAEGRGRARPPRGGSAPEIAA